MLIYTHPMLYQVVNVQNLLKLKHIQSQVRNEFSAGGTGELSANDTWVELYLDDLRDETQANEIIAQMNAQQGQEWMCQQCHELNNGSFELCWHCQADRKF